MKGFVLSPRLHAALLALILAACDKQEPVHTPEDAGASAVRENAALAYREEVHVTMGPLDMEIPMKDSETIKGRVTMTRRFIADVEHPTSRRKDVHVRQYLGQKIGEIFGHDIPRQTTGEDSPLTSKQVVADLTAEGWRFALPQGAPTESEQTDLDELNLSAEGAALFYKGRALKPGQFWNVPLPAFSRWFGKDAMPLAGDIAVEVDRLETVEGEPCVILHVTLDVEGKMRDEEGKTLNMKTVAKGEILRSTRHEIDLRVELGGTIDLYTEIPEENTSMTMSGPIEIVEMRRLP